MSRDQPGGADPPTTPEEVGGAVRKLHRVNIDALVERVRGELGNELLCGDDPMRAAAVRLAELNERGLPDAGTLELRRRWAVLDAYCSACLSLHPPSATDMFAAFREAADDVGSAYVTLLRPSGAFLNWLATARVPTRQRDRMHAHLARVERYLQMARAQLQGLSQIGDSFVGDATPTAFHSQAGKPLLVRLQWTLRDGRHSPDKWGDPIFPWKEVARLVDDCMQRAKLAPHVRARNRVVAERSAIRAALQPEGNGRKTPGPEQ